jgi:hypothetical protein
MRVFAKVVESASFVGAAARLGIAASKLQRHPVLSPPPLGAEASGCAVQLAQGIGCAQPKSKILFYQGSRIAVPSSAHGRGDLQTARVCHRTAVLLVKVSAGGSLLWSPLVAPSASTAMKTQRSQAAATSRPLCNR